MSWWIVVCLPLPVVVWPDEAEACLRPHRVRPHQARRVITGILTIERIFVNGIGIIICKILALQASPNCWVSTMQISSKNMKTYGFVEGSYF